VALPQSIIDAAGSGPSITLGDLPQSIIDAAGGGSGGGGKKKSGFLSGALTQLKDAVYGAIPGTIELAGQIIHSGPPEQIYRSLFQGKPINWGDLAGKPIWKGTIEPTIKAQETYWQHPLRYTEQGDIFDPLLIPSLVVPAVAGRIAAARLATTGAETRAALLTGKIQGPLRTITAPTDAGGTQVLRVLPESGWRAGRMMGTDKVLRAVTNPETPIVGLNARIARAGTRGAQRNYLRMLANPVVKQWVSAFGKLNDNQKVAFGMLKRTPLPEDLERYKTTLAAKGTPVAAQTLHMLEQPEVNHAFQNWEQVPAMKKVMDAYDKMGPAAQKILEDRGAIDPEQIAEGHFAHTMLARGAYQLTKTKVYNHLRNVDARLSRVMNIKGNAVQRAEKLGMPELNSAIYRQGMIQRAIAKIPGLQERYDQVSAEAENAAIPARRLRQQAKLLAEGQLDTSTLHDLGIEIPPETTSISGVGAAFHRSELQGKLDTLQKRLGRVDKETATPGWEQPHIDKITKLQTQVDKLDPVKQAPWRERVQGELSDAKARLKSLRGHAQNRAGLEGQIAKVKQDLADVNSGALVSEPFKDIRHDALGMMQDRLEQRLGPAYDRYEKAIIQQQKLDRQIERALEASEREGKATSDVAAAREARIALLQNARARLHDAIDTQGSLQELRSRIGANKGRLYLPGPPDVHGVPTRLGPEELSKEIEAAGRPQPGYLPDQPAGQVPGGYAMALPGIGAVRAKGTVFGIGGDLFRKGMFDLTGDVLTQRYMANAKWAYQHDLHQWAASIAKRIPKGDDLPPGYEWLRTYRGQRIPYAQGVRAEHLLANEKAFDLSDLQDLTSKDPGLKESEIASDGESLLAVPKGVADHFRNDYRRAQSGVSKMFDKYTQAWRRLILHLRIPWLENNIFGNMVLAGIRFAGVNGLKAFADVIGQTKGGQALQRLAHMPVTERGLNLEDQLHIFPEQARPGTAFGANLPGGIYDRKGLRTIQKLGSATLGLLPRGDIAVETGLRRAAINTVLRGSTEVKALYKAMPKQTRSWRAAMKQGLENNPNLVDMVSREVNDALGDYLSLSPVERGAIRGIVPFYAWYREITRIALKLPLDAPARTAIFLQLGKIGAQTSPSDVPSYLRGGFPIGLRNGQQTIISTRAANPFSSVIDLGSAIAPLFTHPTPTSLSNLAGVTNPLVSSVADALLHPTRSYPLAVQPFLGIGQGLPQYRAAFPSKSTLYPTRSQGDLILQSILGDPRRTYDVGQASSRHALGQ
jgi:hypothetical protein